MPGDIVTSLSPSSYPGQIPAAPTPPAAPAAAYPVGAPPLGLGLIPVLLIVNGDVAVSFNPVLNILVRRR